MHDTAGANYEDKEQAIVDGGGASRDENLVKMWLSAIDAASKEEKDYRLDAEKCIDIYRCKEPQESQTYFNILHSNVETIIPAVYNSTPIPDIRRRYNTDDPVGKQVADLLERAISYSLDSYDFDSTMRSVLFDGYVCGRGVARVRYKPYFSRADDGETPNQESAEHADGTEAVEPDESVVHEEVICEYVPWAQFRRGPGRVWDDVPWQAFEHFLSREELQALDEKSAEAVPLDATVGDHGDAAGSDGYQSGERPPKSEIFGRAQVWEIWDKDRRQVLFIAPGYKLRPLKVVDDPLGLTDFFCTPRPVQPLPVPGNLVPIIPYKAYKRLAEELNDITRRIQNLIKQLRVRGVYAGPASGLADLVNADDGELVPAPSFEQFVDGGGIEKAIAWWPVEPTVKALAQLYAQRNEVKQAIYEVTGLSDILRGSTEASETATAQQIKSQWGALRIQRMQADVARFARDLFRIKAEIIATKFSMQQLMMTTGIELPSAQMKQLAQMAAQQGQGAQIPPDQQEVLQRPTAEEVEKILRSDLLRSYRIDIESDSTIRADLTRDKQEISEFIQGTAAYVSAVGPAVQAGVVPKNLALEIFGSFGRLFRLGKSAEDALDQAGAAAREEAQQPQQPQPNPEVMKAQAEIQQAQQKMQADMQLEQARLQLEERKLQMELEFKQRELEMRMQIEMQKAQLDQQIKAQQAQADMAIRQTESAAKVRQIEAGNVLAFDRHGAEMSRMEADGEMAKEAHQATLEQKRQTAQQKSATK